MINKKDIWFKAKTYGWGWCPCKWQGWIITLIFILLVSSASILIKEKPILFAVSLSILTLILLIICMLKGEKPRWRWGK
jgi:hypothetical protein